jgi:O-antigen/teichoic acid export membrane protein
LAEAQHRNAYYLMLNTATAAAGGLVFWLLLARISGRPPADIGLGYALIALGTIVGVLAKGGLDTALLRSVPGASRRAAAGLLRLGLGLGVSMALLIALSFALVSRAGGALGAISPLGWGLVAAIGALLAMTWLQDAYFLAEGDARLCFWRTLAFSAARILLPIPLVALALPDPAALGWALALAASAAVAAGLAMRLPGRQGMPVARNQFLASAARNVAGSAAEFLPGLLLAPLALAIDGPAAAAYFGVAWTVASLLFLASAAISRSALAQMVRRGSAMPDVLRRGVLQHVAVVAPCAVAAAALAPTLLSLFGATYARQGTPALLILCASVVVVAPSYLYLAVLRARDRSLGLAAFPVAMGIALSVLAPTLESRFGVSGIAGAWLIANAPFGAYAAWRIRREAWGVKAHAAPPVGGPAHLE